jgi:phage virion morphogenesis protein
MIPKIAVDVQGQSQIDALLKSLITALDPRRILDEGAALLFNRTRKRFLQEISPTGEKWVPSRAGLWRKSHGRGGGTLFRTGRLFRSIQLYAISDDTRAIGTNVTSPSGYPYAAKHQFGIGQIARPFLGFGEEDVRLMTNLVFKRIRDEVKTI